MAENPGVYTFLPWVRQGLSGAGLPPDPTAGDLPANPGVPVDVKISQNEAVRKHVRVAGPGDVAGIDPRQVVRCEPAPGTRGFEANYLPCIEFDRPDVPWMFTPASADAQSRLRPWICLIAIREGPGVVLKSEAGQTLNLLEIGPEAHPANQLPNLDESWAWAHAQVSGTLDTPDALDRVLTSSPGRTVSRLICPSRLDPGANYIACVVPTFQLTGLDLPITDKNHAKLKPAWRAGDPSLTTITLPVYYSWRFSTGGAGDFQSLAMQLTAQPAPPELGLREMDVSRAGRGLPAIPPDSPDAVLGFEGALMSPQTVPRGFTNGTGAAFRAALRKVVDPPDTNTSDPAVTPPIYGNRYADVVRIPPDGGQPVWLRELNIDPRYRAAAALGTRVVQDQQEGLMASAWEQMGEIERANGILRNAQLVRTATVAIHRNHLSRLPWGTLLAVSRPVHARVMVTDDATIEGAIARTSTPIAVTTSAFRRVSRPRGPLLRRVLPQAQRTVRPFVRDLSAGTLMVFVPRPRSPIVTLDAVEERFRANGGQRPTPFAVTFGTVQRLSIDRNVPGRPRFLPLPAELPGVPPSGPFFIPPAGDDNETARRFRAAIIAHQDLLAPRVTVAPTNPVPEPRALTKDLADTVMARLDPAKSIPAFVNPLIRTTGNTATSEELEPIRRGPVFPHPMYEALRDLSQDLLLPGLDLAPANSVMILKPNPRFIEAYMAGLNHEIGRELVWRGFPADAKATPFRQFWDNRGSAGTRAPDIPPMDTWPPAKALGEVSAASSHHSLVLLIRGELLRRYPTAIVYVKPAVWPAGQPRPTLEKELDLEMHPLFRGSLKPDVAFFGFALTLEAARGTGTPDSPGFFFVLQEHPTEPRFGVETTEVAGPLSPAANSAETARKYLQHPVRVAIHALDLLSAI